MVGKIQKIYMVDLDIIVTSKKELKNFIYNMYGIMNGREVMQIRNKFK